MKQELLRIENGIKEGILEQIYLQIFQGEITNLIFDNLQEKQTFLKILRGEKTFDYGRVYYKEKRIKESDFKKVFLQSIIVITRESNLLNSISIGQNIFLARPKVRENWIKDEWYNRETNEIFAKLGIVMDVEKAVGKLTILERVQVEIVKAYLCECKIIFLTALSNLLMDAELKKLYQLLELLMEKGLAIVLVEPLEDIWFEYSNTITIVKKGKTRAVKPGKTCDYKELHTILHGDNLHIHAKILHQRNISESEKKEPEVEFENLCSERLFGLSFALQRGQIMKVFCVDEASYDELWEVLSGYKNITNGKLYIRGKESKLKKRFRGLQNGMGVVNGNPAENSLFLDMSAMDNLCVPISRKAGGVWLIPRYRKSVKKLLKDILEEEVYHKKIEDLNPVEVQQIIYCRWLLYAPDVVVCIHPFAEGDIKAREKAREMIYLLEERGIATIIITSNTAELNYCRGDEIFVKRGRLIKKEEANSFLYSRKIK